MTIVAGVDEAGRGSVLGPLVIAGIAVEKEDIPKLKKLGVKDSKLLLPARRNELVREIRRIAVQIAWQKIQPKIIDEVVIRGTKLMRLNYLEAQYMARILEKMKFEIAYIDCCDTVQKRFGNLVADLLYKRIKERRKEDVKFREHNQFRRKIISEHHADTNYPVVSAASIVAKVRRDECISLLHKRHGIFGSGYPSDPDTKKYLKGFVERSEAFPSITRLSWITIRNMVELAESQKITSKPIDEFSTIGGELS